MTLTTLQNKVYLLTTTNSSSFPSTDLNAAINNALERVVSLINQADQRWQFDDSNQTDLPMATTALVSGQADYSLATSHLSIDRVEILDSSSNWWLLKPIDEHDIRFQALAEGESNRGGAYLATTGRPLQYDKIGNSIILLPTPNYSLAAALKIYFTRGPVTLVNGSDVPGFNSLFHDLIAYYVAYEYSVANSLGSQKGLMQGIVMREQNLKDFYAQRSRDERPRMGVSTNTVTGAYSGTSGILTAWGSDSNR